MRRITAEERRAMTEWAAMGFAVVREPDGTLRVEPRSPEVQRDAFDMVDMRRK
jgi:hypothetical protein